MDPEPQPLQRPQAQPSNPQEKALLCLVLLIYCFGGYYGIAFVQGDSGHSLYTALDDAIPFVPVFMYAYVIVYTSLFIPVFTVRCQRLFRRVAAAYALVVTICLLTWAVFPVSATDLRPDLSQADTSWFHVWGLRVNYALDPPKNLFPSLHVAIAVLASCCAYTADRTWGLLSLIPAVLVTASICLVKQHYAVDGIAGAAVALFAWAVVLRPYDATRAPGSAYGWRGPASYLVLHCLVILALKIAQLAGWKPYL